MTDTIKIEETSRDIFSQALEKKCLEQQLGYIEALAEIIEDCDADPSIIAKLLSEPVKQKIQAEALNNNLLRGEHRLPELMF